MGVDGWEQDFKNIFLVQKCFSLVTEVVKEVWGKVMFLYLLSFVGAVSQHAMGRGCIPACYGKGLYPSMPWEGAVSQHAMGRGCIPACHGYGGVYFPGRTPPGHTSWADIPYVEMTIEVGGTYPTGMYGLYISTPAKKFQMITAQKHNVFLGTLRLILDYPLLTIELIFRQKCTNYVKNVD